MAARSWIPLLAAALVAAVCVRLGLWQLERLEQRKARNATIAAAFRDAPIEAQLARSHSVTRFRRIVVRGRWDYARETTVGGRTRSGSPGVHIITPMILDDADTEILVNRGWVYSPDARTVDLPRWHEGARAEFIGYLDDLPSSLRESRPLSLYVVALADSVAQPATVGDRPARLSVPAFGDEGPHLNYAVQWFSFAAIALVGAPIVVRRQRRRRE
jgi:surfeit locus 1 family protein